MTTRERKMIESLNLVNGYAHTTTASGKKAAVYQNFMNLDRPYFQMYIEGKIVFTRGTIAKVFQTLNNN